MQSINELREMVKSGEIRRDEAVRIIASVQNLLSESNEAIKGGSLKTAGMGEAFLTTLAASAAMTAGGLGVNLAIGAYDKHKLEQKHDKSFRDMMRLKPDLAALPPGKAEEYFSIFKTMTPTMATNPHLAGNFVERQGAAFGGVGFEEAGQLARAEQAVAAGKPQSAGKMLGDSLVQQGVASLGSNVNQITRNKIDNQLYSAKEMGERSAQQDIASKQYMASQGYHGGKSQHEIARDALAKSLGKEVATNGMAPSEMISRMKELESVKTASAKQFLTGLMAGL